MPVVGSLAAASARGLGMFGGKPPVNVEYLVVGGGGGGGNAVKSYDSAGGGGGGGEVKTGTLSAMSLGVAYTITIGAGGAEANDIGSPVPTAGDSSTFSTVTASGGSAGGYQMLPATLGAPGAGVNGGGGASIQATGQTGGDGSAFDGGNGLGNTGNNGAGGGGAGANGNGGNGTTTAGGAAGAGLASSISGSSVTYGTGGVGGRSAVNSVAGTNASANTGDGGGGASNNKGSGRRGGKGGSGVVIIKIPDTYTATFSAGTNTETTSGGFKIITCTQDITRTVTFS